MSNLEHYFENLLFQGQDVIGDWNKNTLTEAEQEAVRICADYVLYTIFLNRDDFLKFVNGDTNADRTRHMPDEELAKWISHIAYCSDCPMDRQCPINAEQCQGDRRKCYLAWLEWLKSEA